MTKVCLIIFGLLLLTQAAVAEENPDTLLLPENEPTLPGGDFLLHSSRGDFRLSELKGKVVLLYFGYTQCPDICPTSLSVITQALNGLNADELAAVRGVFISVDPKRDSYQALDEYVEYFHPNLIGVTGDEDEVAAVAKQYGAQYRAVPLEGSGLGYAVDHSAVVYLITPEGELRFTFPHETPAFMILEAIRYVLTNRD
ncbi:MAG: SCO family protein [Candidatus Thiodiazotropha sp.]